MTTPQQRHRVLAGLSRSRLLTVLGASARPMSVRELADAVDLHPNTARAHLDQLVDAGLAVRDTASPAGRGRPGLRYAAIPGSDEQDPGAYRALAGVLAEQLAHLPDSDRAALAAGDRWGQALARGAAAPATARSAMDRLIELLDGAGFAPEAPTTDDQSIRLRRCPFRSLTREHGPMICGVHLGLMRGALRELGAPFDVTGLEPFVQPDLCLAHVGGRSVG